MDVPSRLDRLRRPELPLGGPASGIEEMLEQYRLETRAADARKRDVVLVVVHGTFANSDFATPGRAGTRHWWQSGGSFAVALDAALEQHGSRARCDLPVEWELRPAREDWDTHWRGWSGGNSEFERRRGAYHLAGHIRTLQRHPQVGRIHFVAHSHGGNVVRRALRYLNEPWTKLGTIVCLGTPFLHFDDAGAWRRWMGRIHWPMLLVLAGLSLTAWWMLTRGSEPNEVTMAFLGAVGAAAAYALWRYARTSEASSWEARPIAVRFARDEAVQMLRTCAAVAAEPHLYLRDLLGGPVASHDPAPRPRRLTRWDGWFDRLSRACSEAWRLTWNGVAAASTVWNGPICRAAERATSLGYRLPLVGHPRALMLILLFRPYRPPLRPFLSSRMPRLASLFFHSMEEESRRMVEEAMPDRPGQALPAPWWHDPMKGTLFHPQAAQSIAAAVAAALYVVLYPLDKLLGLPAWLGAVGTRFAILIGARAAAGGAPGVDVLGAAFRPARTGDVPDGGTDAVVPVEIERDIEQRLDEGSRIDFTVLRAGIDPARRASLLEAIHVAFTDVGLLHAQYYQDPRIIDYIARCITGQSPLEWQTEATGSAARDTPAAGP